MIKFISDKTRFFGKLSGIEFNCYSDFKSRIGIVLLHDYDIIFLKTDNGLNEVYKNKIKYI